jgi:CRISPR-associated protein Cas2
MKQTRNQAIPYSHSKRWLLAHDIRDPRRLQRVWRYLRQEGLRLQFSVYILAGTRHQIETVLEHLRTLIDEQADDVRVYPLSENTRIWGLGSQFGDYGNTLCDALIDKIVQSEATPVAIEKPIQKLSF